MENGEKPGNFFNGFLVSLQLYVLLACAIVCRDSVSGQRIRLVRIWLGLWVSMFSGVGPGVSRKGSFVCKIRTGDIAESLNSSFGFFYQ